MSSRLYYLMDNIKNKPKRLSKSVQPSREIISMDNGYELHIRYSEIPPPEVIGEGYSTIDYCELHHPNATEPVAKLTVTTGNDVDPLVKIGTVFDEHRSPHFGEMVYNTLKHKYNINNQDCQNFISLVWGSDGDVYKLETKVEKVGDASTMSHSGQKMLRLINQVREGKKSVDLQKADSALDQKIDQVTVRELADLEYLIPNKHEEPSANLKQLFYNMEQRRLKEKLGKQTPAGMMPSGITKPEVSRVKGEGGAPDTLVYAPKTTVKTPAPSTFHSQPKVPKTPKTPDLPSLGSHQKPHKDAKVVVESRPTGEAHAHWVVPAKAGQPHVKVSKPVPLSQFESKSK